MDPAPGRCPALGCLRSGGVLRGDPIDPPAAANGLCALLGGSGWSAMGVPSTPTIV